MKLKRVLMTLEGLKAIAKPLPVVGTIFESIFELLTQGCRAAEVWLGYRTSLVSWPHPSTTLRMFDPTRLPLRTSPNVQLY
jgi:hypothetical protein